MGVPNNGAVLYDNNGQNTGIEGNPLHVTGDSSPSSDLVVSIDTNNAVGDAFGRLRVSEPYAIFENKLLDGSGDLTWSTETNGTGSGSKVDATSSYDMSVSANNDFVIRQTIQRYNYQSGKSQLVLITGVMSTASGTNSSIGLAEGEHGNHVSPFPIYNGIYFKCTDGTMSVNIANNGSITSVDQSNWNIDVMDGSGVSGVTADFTKANIYVVDYEWLGIGRVRMGLNIDGVTYIVHEFKHAGIVSNVYILTPNLPIRYELRSTGSAGTMKQICSSISSEGGREATGYTFIGTSNYLAVPTSGAFNTNPANHSIFAAVRHQEARPYSFVRLINQQIITEGDSILKWSIARVPGTLEISDNGTPTALDDLTFTALPNSTLEFYQFDITQDTVADADISGYIIEEGYVPSGGSGPFTAGAINLGSTGNINSIGEELDGSRWCFLFSIQSYGINNARSSLKLTEVI